jgi:hypothetical protein
MCGVSRQNAPPMSLQIPLIAGESVLTPGVEVRKEMALVGLARERRTPAGARACRAPETRARVPENAARSEVWNFVVNPQWNVVFEGFPPILPDNVSAPMWVFRFAPRPGEKLALTVTRPPPVPGATLAIDSVFQQVTFGKRSSHTQLRARVRSTKGGRHVIRLPEDARVTEVIVDRKPQQLRPEKGELPLSLTPGCMTSWCGGSRRGKCRGGRTAEVDLRSPCEQCPVRSAPAGIALAAHGLGTGHRAGGALLERAGGVHRHRLVARPVVEVPIALHEWLLLGPGSVDAVLAGVHVRRRSG